MFFRIFVACLSIFMFSIHTGADDSSATDRFMSLVFKDDLIVTLKDQMIKNAVVSNPEFAQYTDELKEWADNVFAVDTIKEQVFSFFDTTLSSQDMQAVVSFYESEAGKRFLASNNALSKHIQKLMHQRFSTNIAGLHEIISQKKQSTLEDINTLSFSGAKVEDPAGKYHFKFEKNKWRLLEQNLTQSADFSFEHSDGSIMGVIISESRAIDSDALKEAAKRNLRMGSDRMKVIKEEDMTIDSSKGYFLEMNARMRSQELRYYGYVVGGANGGVQVLCWTYANQARENRRKAVDFLKGLQPFLN
ncbi:MAG: DUF2059 domain-containing protein [Chitinivibrionales bacterium]